MEEKTCFTIKKSPPLAGKAVVGGAKNAILPQIAAAALTEETVELVRVPRLADALEMAEILRGLGGRADWKNEHLRMNGALSGTAVAEEHARKLRASFLFLGPLLARTGRATVALPGGCMIGARPVDLHLKGLAAMGAELSVEEGCVQAKCRRLNGTLIYLDYPSVGATENLLMAASLARGRTVIENAAKEPEVVDLTEMLIAMGAQISGSGTGTLKIEGVEKLGGVKWQPIPDRIEAGTLMVATAITGGNVLLQNAKVDHLRPVIAKLRQAGVDITEYPRSLRVKAERGLRAVDIRALPYPGFPTDMQAPIAALACAAEGVSTITETVFENRFLYAGELARMGAQIHVEDRTASITGSRLTGASVSALDLRAGAMLVLAGLIAEGVTRVENIERIDRGYDRLEEKLAGLGAPIIRGNGSLAEVLRIG